MEDIQFSELAKKLISYAICAPSGHNSQPWKFQVANEKIIILPDFTKHLEVVDASDKELFISLGCALENLQIAAKHYGYSSDYVYENEKIVVSFNKQKDNLVTEEDDTLFNAIKKRHTHRGKFSGQKIPDDKLNVVENTENASVLIFNFESEGVKHITENILKGNSIQMSDDGFKNELIDWMRFNKNHIEETHNGLCYNVLGFPPTPRFLGPKIIKMFLTPAAQNKTDNEINASTSHFCVFTVKEVNTKNYIELGTLLEQFILKITSLGLSYSFSNQPCEVLEVSEILRKELKISDYPAVIIRVGYGKEPKNFSPRETPEIQFLE